MPYESCAKKYSHYFSPDLKKIFSDYRAPIPFILEVVDEQCQDTDCSHHVLSLRYLLRDPGAAEIKSIASDWVDQCHGCMCLLHLIHADDLTMETIGDAVGVSRNLINLIEQNALKMMKFRVEKHFSKRGGGPTRAVGLSDLDI